MTEKHHEKLILNAVKRSIVGKGVKKLRRNGLIPGNVYGEGFTSTAIELPQNEFAHIYRKAGETQVIHVMIDKTDIPVIIHQTQHHPITDALLHVDFRKVDLTKKTQTEVPLKFIGESPAIEGKKGDLITEAETVTVEALPDNIPTVIEIDISGLIEPGSEIKAGSLKKNETYVILTDPEKTLLRIIEHKEEEIEAPPPAEEVVEGEEGAKGVEETRQEAGGETADEKGKEKTDETEKSEKQESKPDTTE